MDKITISYDKADTIMQTLAKIEQFKYLPQNWDSYNGLPIDEKAISTAVTIIGSLAATDVPMPSIVPTSDGGLSLEWQNVGQELTITIPPGEEAVSVYFWDSSGEEWTENISKG